MVAVVAVVAVIATIRPSIRTRRGSHHKRQRFSPRRPVRLPTIGGCATRLGRPQAWRLGAQSQAARLPQCALLAGLGLWRLQRVWPVFQPTKIPPELRSVSGLEMRDGRQRGLV